MLPFRSRFRHPLFPDLAAVPARDAHRTATALAGTFSELAAAADRAVEATRAVFVLHSIDDPEFSDVERDALWQLFQVPVYALRLGRTGGVAAYECEAQEGMHVHPGAAIEGDVASEPCPCGRPGPRLLWDPAAASCAAD